jgi:uncharacterized protein (DUF2235 family)
VGRKIVLLSDGTGNSAAKVWRTNVWRVFESLDLSGSDQVAFYDDGVGTSSFKPVAIMGGAFGYGLKRNVIDIYKFACRNHRSEDDEIYGFGFSRGAFTMRVVIGLILEQGLVVAASENELHAKAKAAYRAFRRENFHTLWPRYFRPEAVARWIRDLVVRSDYSKADNRHGAKIRFLGLWDTVAAYGMPVDEMTRGISQWIWPLQLPSCRLDGSVERACHALSIDDERTTFHPILWDEGNEEPLAPRTDGKRYLGDERISQVWFAGVHTNVGGGYPDDSLAQIPLIWMLSEAQACGLRFKESVDANPQTLGHPHTAQDKDGRIYDSRQGLGGYYRYGPRKILELGRELLSRKNGEAFPRIHESVLKRIHNNAHLYAPKGLPARYEVVTGDCEVLAPEQNPYETTDQAQARSNFQEKVWNIIWWRRIVYFMTVAVTLYLVAFPLMRALPLSAELENPLRWASDIVRTAGAFLPPVATPWIEGYARDPGRFIVVAVILAGMLWWGSRLAARIQNQMGIHWRKSLNSELADPGKPDDPIYKMRTSPIYIALHTGLKKYVAPAFFALLFVYLGLTFMSHVLFNIQDDAGWVCREKPVEFGKDPKNPNRVIVQDLKGLKNLERGQTMHVQVNGTESLPEFETSALCQSMGVWLERNGKYLIKFESADSFRDGDIEASKGFYSTDPPSIWRKVWMIAAVPLRRELIRPWFRVVVRIGGVGGEENFLDPDITDKYLINEERKATRDGELFLFVNDAVVGIPGLYGIFYKNNRGSTKVTITRR